LPSLVEDDARSAGRCERDAAPNHAPGAADEAHAHTGHDRLEYDAHLELREGHPDASPHATAER
jgi:hypothetical protein